jgi:hypothetical protein
MTQASWLFWYGDDLKINKGNVMKTRVTTKNYVILNKGFGRWCLVVGKIFML